MIFQTSILLLAIILGIKHSLDVDHVVAISSILLRAKGMWKTVKLSTAWALGHMVTASIITFILFQFKEFFLTRYLPYFESIVAFMLILIAVLTVLWEFDIIKFGKHTHGHIHPEKGEIHPPHDEAGNHESTSDSATELTHSHLQVLEFKGEYKTLSGIGIVHGLASNDELLLLLTVSLALSTLGQMLFGVFIFTLGVVFGMVLYGTVLKAPIAKYGHDKVIRVVNLTIAAITLAYAFYILAGGETLNLVPFLDRS